MAKSIFLVQQVTWLWAFLDNLMSSLWQVQYFICPLSYATLPTSCFPATQEKVLTSSIWSDEHLCENWIIALPHWHLKELNVCILHWICPQPIFSFNFSPDSYSFFSCIFLFFVFAFFLSFIFSFNFFISLICLHLLFSFLFFFLLWRFFPLLFFWGLALCLSSFFFPTSMFSLSFYVFSSFLTSFIQLFVQ